jgi:hypothetical protein
LVFSHPRKIFPIPYVKKKKKKKFHKKGASGVVEGIGPEFKP